MLNVFPQAKLAFERLNVDKDYHPFICGPNNKNIQALAEKTGARINVPPPSVMKNEIVVSGEKDGVHEAVTSIMKLYDEKVRFRGSPNYSNVKTAQITIVRKQFFLFGGQVLESNCAPPKKKHPQKNPI